jgi:cobalt-zinc-cadmium efflux system outer membrane protein
MIRLITRAVLGVASAGMLAGCASVPKEAGFGDVRSEVERRAGHRVQWNRLTADDRSVAAAVNELLAQGLTAEGAVQVALLNNRRLQATYEDLGVAQADVVQAGLLRNPVFDGDVKFFEGGEGTKVELAAVQDFLDVFFIPLRQRIAATAFESEKLRVTGTVLDLVGEVRTAFYTHAAAEQALELRRTVVAATEASYDIARRIREAGNMTALDVANERALHEQAKLDLAVAEAAALDTRERLNVVLGLWGPRTTWTVQDRLPDPPADEVPAEGIERRAVERNLDLAMTRHQIEAAARTLGIRRSMGLLPEAEAGVAAEREVDGAWGAGPAFSLPVPIFNQGQPAMAGARSALERVRQQYVATAVEVRSAARTARNRLLAARARADYFRQVILPLRQEITRQTQLQYNAMQVGPFQLLQARQGEIDAGVQYIDALRDYWIARAQLEQVESGRTTGIGQNGVSMMSGAPGASSRGRDAGGH